MKSDSPKWVKIYSFSDLQTAYIIKGALDAEEIPSMIPSDTMATVYPTTLSWSSIDIYVPEGYVSEASAVLRANDLEPCI
ncbi:MAG: DUF2007 domain-containing protein [Muribaculaceae bacterium]|nr:DUF2007 domain-containing protein [Muribaculaceae bacterium]